MNAIKNVYEFPTLCIFAEKNLGIFYNQAHKDLDEVYPYSYKVNVSSYHLDDDSGDRLKSDVAVRILRAFLQAEGVNFINIIRG